MKFSRVAYVDPVEKPVPRTKLQLACRYSGKPKPLLRGYNWLTWRRILKANGLAIEENDRDNTVLLSPEARRLVEDVVDYAGVADYDFDGWNWCTPEEFLDPLTAESLAWDDRKFLILPWEQWTIGTGAGGVTWSTVLAHAKALGILDRVFVEVAGSAIFWQPEFRDL